jgi:hypothetical protein
VYDTSNIDQEINTRESIQGTVYQHAYLLRSGNIRWYCQRLSVCSAYAVGHRLDFL